MTGLHLQAKASDPHRSTTWRQRRAGYLWRGRSVRNRLFFV